MQRMLRLQNAMQRHPHNIEVQREACGAIRSLTSDNAKNKTRAGSIGLLAELQLVTVNHIGNPGILKVCAVVENQCVCVWTFSEPLLCPSVDSQMPWSCMYSQFSCSLVSQQDIPAEASCYKE